MNKARRQLLSVVAISLTLITSGCLETPKKYAETHGDNSNPDTDPLTNNVDYIAGQWLPREKIAEDVYPDAGSVAIEDLRFIPTINANGFLNWHLHTLSPRQGLAYFDAVSSQWSASTPVPENQTAERISIVYDAISSSTLATWVYQNNAYVSSFNNAWQPSPTALGIAQKAHALVDNTGKQFILSQSNIGNGFSLNLYQRGSASQNWSTQAAQLQRTDATTTPVIHLLSVMLDDNNQPFAVWLEQNATGYSLYSSLFTNNSWQVPTQISLGATINAANIENLHLRNMSAGNISLIFSVTDPVIGKQIYNLAYAQNMGWQNISRLDSDKTNTHIDVGPYLSNSSNGNLVVAWIEHEGSSANKAEPEDNTLTKLSARHGDGGMYKLITREQRNTTWLNEIVATQSKAGFSIGMPGIHISDTGTQVMSWTEKGHGETRILTSHVANGAWTQKQLVSQLNSMTTQIQASYTDVRGAGIGHTFWAENATDAVGTRIDFFRAKSANTIGTIGDNGNNNDNGNGNPGNDNNGQNDLPTNQNWSRAANPVLEFNNPSGDQIIGPKLLIDNSGNKTLFMAQKPLIASTGNNSVSTTIRRHNGVQWNDILSDSTILTDLNQPIEFNQLRIAPGTGALFALLKDSTRVYVAYYSPEGGWSKTLINNLNSDNTSAQLHINPNNNEATLIFQPDNTTLQAIHFSAIGTQLHDTPMSINTTDAKLLGHTHNITSDGRVHIAWAGYNAETKLQLHTASYTPNNGWTKDNVTYTSPLSTEIHNAHYVVTRTGKRILLQHDESAGTLLSTLRNTNGTWGETNTIIHNFLPTSDASFGSFIALPGTQGNVMLLWKQSMKFNSISMNMYQSIIFTDANDRWSTTRSVSGALHGRQSSLSAYMISENQATAAWIQTDENGVSVYANQYINNIGWGNAELIRNYADAGRLLRQVNVATDASGKPKLIWNNYSFANPDEAHQIWYSERH